MNPGYAVIDLALNAIVQRPHSLPCRVAIDFAAGVGIVDFDQLGQVAPDADYPTHKIVAIVLESAPPAEPHRITATVEIIETDQVTVTHTFEPLPVPVPGSISDRQFFQQLAIMEEITEEEAEAAVATGEIPTAMLALVDMLPPEQQFPARMLLKGATVFERDHPMTETIASLYEWSEAQTDDLFRAASLL